MFEPILWRLLRKLTILGVLTLALLTVAFGPGPTEAHAQSCCSDCQAELDFCIYLCDDSQQGWPCWRQCEERYWACTSYCDPPGC